MAVGVSPGELRELTDEELAERLRESKEELFNLRFQMATGPADQQPSAPRRASGDRARLHRAAGTRTGPGVWARWLR